MGECHEIVAFYRRARRRGVASPPPVPKGLQMRCSFSSDNRSFECLGWLVGYATCDLVSSRDVFAQPLGGATWADPPLGVGICAPHYRPAPLYPARFCCG